MREVIKRYVERLMNESTPDAPLWNIEHIRQGKKPAWNYIDGCMMTSLLTLWRKTGEQRYYDFVENFMDYYVADDGSLLGYSKEDYNLDHICEGRVLFDVYKESGKEKYRLAIEKLYEQLKEQPRTADGNFWHKKIYPNQVWLDGLYMAQVFYTRYETEFNNKKNYDDIIAQFRSVREHMYDEDTRLYRHGYDASRSIFWAGEDGKSLNCWLRSMGWYLVALADVYSYLDPAYETGRAFIASLLREAVDGILPYRDAQSGMFMQVVDQGRRDGNYPETSGTSMVAYACISGAQTGALDESYLDVGRSIFDSMCSCGVLTEREGKLNLGSICLVAGLGPENNTRRDGSYEYYISEPIVENDAKGVAPFIMCYAANINS